MALSAGPAVFLQKYWHSSPVVAPMPGDQGFRYDGQLQGQRCVCVCVCGMAV